MRPHGFWPCLASPHFPSPSLISLFTRAACSPLVVGLFHFNLIRTPRQEKAVRGGLATALGESVARCPLLLMGIWRQDRLILVSSVNTIRNLWVLKRQYPA